MKETIKLLKEVELSLNLGKKLSPEEKEEVQKILNNILKNLKK